MADLSLVVETYHHLPEGGGAPFRAELLRRGPGGVAGAARSYGFRLTWPDGRVALEAFGAPTLDVARAGVEVAARDVLAGRPFARGAAVDAA